MPKNWQKTKLPKKEEALEEAIKNEEIKIWCLSQ